MTDPISTECVICYKNKKIHSIRCRHSFCYSCICKMKCCAICRTPIYAKKIELTSIYTLDKETQEISENEDIHSNYIYISESESDADADTDSSYEDFDYKNTEKTHDSCCLEYSSSDSESGYDSSI